MPENFQVMSIKIEAKNIGEKTKKPPMMITDGF